MPNHIHCIFILDYSKQGGRQSEIVREAGVEKYASHPNRFSKPVKGSVPVFIGQFKSLVTSWCNNNGYANFGWQPRFHDHIIRDAAAHEAIRFYIQNNAKAWNEDELYLGAPGE